MAVMHTTTLKVATAIQAARAFEPLGIRWLEEPVHWYDRVEGLRQVAETTSIPIALGEQLLHRCTPDHDRYHHCYPHHFRNPPSAFP